mmetsp:Transcript_136547/g.236981  ORF Transcript_136547/g.236981 Transcript_136547/m.236981 type:complete len:722 (-) Transcript_136547:799-2964(-)
MESGRTIDVEPAPQSEEGITSPSKNPGAGALAIGANDMDGQIPMSFAITQLYKRIQTNKLYPELVIYICFVITFTFFLLWGKNTGDSYYSIKSIQDLLTNPEFPDQTTAKYFGDSALPDDFQDWIAGVVLPALWDSGNPDKPGKMPRYAQGENIILGALRVRMMRVKQDGCSINTAIYGDNAVANGVDTSCRPPWSLEAEQTGPYTTKTGHVFNYTDPNNGEYHGTTTSGDIGSYHPGGYTIILHFNSSYNEIKEQIEIMNKNYYVDHLATRFVMVEMFAYIPQFDQFLSAKMFHEITSGGSWVPNTQFRIFKVWTQNMITKTIYDLFFALFVFYYFFKMFMEWLKEYKRTRRFFSWILQVWNMLEFINIMCFLGTLFLRVLWFRDSMTKKFTLHSLIHGSYPVQLESSLWLYSMQVYTNSINNLLTYMKVLKYVRLNDRLNILTRTMEICQRNIVGSLLLFIYLVAALSLTGNSLYGNGMYEWRNVNTAFSTVGRMLVGDFDYPAMREENRYMTAIYFWLVIFIGLYLMLSAIIVAIICEGFTQVSVEQSNTPLDIIISRWWSKFKKHPFSGFAITCFSGKRSEEQLLYLLGNVLQAAYRQQKMDLNQNDELQVDDSAICFGFSDIKTLLPSDVWDEMKGDLIDDIWEELLFEWGCYMKNDVQLQNKVTETRLLTAMQDWLKPEEKMMDNIIQKVRKLHVEVNNLLEDLAIGDKPASPLS